MRILLIDIDTLRPDHLGCYGYGRNTSPCIDAVAREGVVFDRYYTPNAPCLPSRASLFSGQYGIHNGVVGHGGTAGDMRIQGRERDFMDEYSTGRNLTGLFRRAGMHTVSISTFAERHSAWWFNANFNETYNVGGCGCETADQVTPVALKWLSENGKKDNWMLHYHIWDPHTPYRTPADFGEPFQDEPLPDDWITEEIFAEHLQHVGPHCAREIGMWNSDQNPNFPKHLGEVRNLAEVRNFLNQYDNGIRFSDDNVAMLIRSLKELGIYEDTAIIITSDHGENMGELGLYAEHATADEPCCHIPMIIKWPGVEGGRRDSGIHVNVDLAPTMAELLGQPAHPKWDGESYARVLTEGADCGRECAILTQCAHVCQRAARFDDYIYIRTVHGGYHLFDDEMLFNVVEDPHQLHNLASQRKDLCAQGAKYIQDWEYDMMKHSDYDTDPMWTVMREGGPLHCRGQLQNYVKRLQATGRGQYVDQLLAKYPGEP